MKSSSVIVREATSEDVTRVIGDLSHNSSIEYIHGDLKAVMEESDQLFVGYIHGEAVMLGGLTKASLLSGRVFLWGLQTRSAGKHALRFIRETRRFIDSLGKPVYCYCRYDARWLELIGFRPIGQVRDLIELQYGDW